MLKLRTQIRIIKIIIRAHQCLKKEDYQRVEEQILEFDNLKYKREHEKMVIKEQT